MPSPFPGMAPYLEDPNIFPDFHHRLATELSIVLNRRLPDAFYARVEMRPEVGIIDEGGRELTRPIIPDVLVLRGPSQRGTAVLERSEVAIEAGPRADVSPWIHLDRLGDETARHAFVEIRDPSRGHKLVTSIEVLSPSDKWPGSDRMAYEAKQREVLESDASLLEIELLRDGRRILPNLHLGDALNRLRPRPDYLVLVNHAWMRDNQSLGDIAFPIGLRDPPPCIPVPLKQGHDELPLDLQFVFRNTYDSGPYRRRAMDYSSPPSPQIPADSADWAATFLLA